MDVNGKPVYYRSSFDIYKEGTNNFIKLRLDYIDIDDEYEDFDGLETINQFIYNNNIKEDFEGNNYYLSKT